MLSEQELWWAMFCAVEERQARDRGKPPGLARWNDQLIEALRRELAASRSRQSSSTDQQHSKHDDEWISARQVGAMMCWNVRRVQRHAPALGRRKIDGRLVFRESIIREHIEGSAA